MIIYKIDEREKSREEFNMDHGDGSDHFHHSCCRYIHHLPKVSKVGICCGYYLYHDLVTVQEEVNCRTVIY